MTFGVKVKVSIDKGVGEHAPMPWAIRMSRNLGRHQALKFRPKSPPCKRIRARLNVPRKILLSGSRRVNELFNTQSIRSRTGSLIHTQTHTHTHTYIYIYIYFYIYTYIYIYIYIYMYIYLFIYLLFIYLCNIYSICLC